MDFDELEKQHLIQVEKWRKIKEVLGLEVGGVVELKDKTGRFRIIELDTDEGALTVAPVDTEQENFIEESIFFDDLKVN